MKGFVLGTGDKGVDKTHLETAACGERNKNERLIEHPRQKVISDVDQC